jgi:CheY-like chemotaxis protein
MSSERHVLLVDDEFILVILMRDVLEHHGYIIHEAANALSAFEQLQRHPEIGLVVTDVRMPGASDGRALAQYIRSEKPALPIIIVSGSPVRHHDVPQGGVIVMMKPIDITTFVRAVKELLPLARAEGS